MPQKISSEEAQHLADAWAEARDRAIQWQKEDPVGYERRNATPATDRDWNRELGPVAKGAISIYAFIGLAGAVLFVLFTLFGLVFGNAMDTPIHNY